MSSGYTPPPEALTTVTLHVGINDIQAKGVVGYTTVVAGADTAITGTFTRGGQLIAAGTWYYVSTTGNVVSAFCTPFSNAENPDGPSFTLGDILSPTGFMGINSDPEGYIDAKQFSIAAHATAPTNTPNKNGPIAVSNDGALYVWCLADTTWHYINNLMIGAIGGPTDPGYPGQVASDTSGGLYVYSDPPGTWLPH
jgi:hypothetical protein